MPDWDQLLKENAAAYARVAIDNIGREFPSGIHHTMTGPGDFPGRPRDRTPVFYGSYDWHSCVEMHWLLVRLLRIAADFGPADEITALLDRQFDPRGLAAEAEYIAGRDGRGQRPYGWGWALALVHEVSSLAAASAAAASAAAAAAAAASDAAASDAVGRWSAALAPLADAVTGCFLSWLPKATYPVRYGMHQNSAFGLSQALPYALDRSAAGDGRLAAAISEAASHWFGADRDYPAAWEPSGSDFLSPALTEAELMAQLLPADQFADWLTGFLPEIGAGEPAVLFRAAIVSDSTDGQIAHLHGLNASRAWCWRRIAGRLPAGDQRTEAAVHAAAVHAAAALPHVVGDDYAVEHWLAAYAVLMLTPDRGPGPGHANVLG